MGADTDNELARAHLRVFERRRLDWLFLLCLCVFLLPPRNRSFFVFECDV